MVGARRKSWVMKTSSKPSTFEALAEGRTTSFTMSRRSITGTSGGLNAPQVVVSVTEELAKPEDTGPENKNRHRSGRNWFPFPRIHIPFFSRGTKHENKQASPCRESTDGPCTPTSGAPVRHSMDVPTYRRVPALSGLSPSYRQWPPTSNSPEVQCHSSRQASRQPFSPAPHRTAISRAGGSLDFWSSSMALAGFYPNRDIDTAEQLEGEQSPLQANGGAFAGQHSRVSSNFGNGRITPGRMGRSTSDGNFQSHGFHEGENGAASPAPRLWTDGNVDMVPMSATREKFADWQTKTGQGMDVDIQSPALLTVEDHPMTREERQNFIRQSEERRISMHFGGPDIRLSMDSLQRPFGSCFEDESNRALTPHINSQRAGGQAGLSPIMLYSENLAAASNINSGAAIAGSFYHGLSYENQFNPPPPPPISGSTAFDSALYSRSLYFEQLVLKEPAETQSEDGLHDRVSPRTAREHRYYDVPDYPTTVASCSNRSHLNQELGHAPSQEDAVEEENTIRAWLDELEERVAYRRKECTYRIACQRAFIKQMKDKLLASKLALNRLKHGLGPELSERVMELRMKFSSRRRLRNIAQLLLQKEEDEYDLWAGPMMDMEIEVGYESDSSWISVDDEYSTN